MLTFGLEKQIFRIVAIIAATVTLVVTPYSVADPINLPKMVLLVTLAGGIVVLILFHIKSLAIPSRKVIFIVSILIIINLLLLLASHHPMSFEIFYGTSGRNTGVLTYIALIILMLGCVVIASENIILGVLRILLAVGLLLLAYGNIQFFGFEPFSFISPYESKVIGTFGNPNFQSAFVGILAAAITPLFFNKSSQALRWIFSLSFIVLCAVSILQTNSIQGYFCMSFGLGVAVLIYFISFKRKKLAILVGFFLISGIILIALSFLNIGPISNLIYKSSMAARFFYWKIALKIMIDNPIMGIGLDQYGDWLRRYRSATEVTTNFTADSAHSIYLDIGVGGGFPLLILFLLIAFLVLVSVVKVLRRNHRTPTAYIALVGGWAAFQAQSLISINQIGVAIWGWIFTGLLVGYEINTRSIVNSEVNRVKSNREKNKKIIEVHPKFLVASILGLVLGLIIALPPFVSAQNYYNSLKVGKISEIKNAVYQKPYHRKSFLQASDIFRQNNYTSDSLEVARIGVVHFPNSFWLWSIVAQLSPEDSTDYLDAMKTLHALDPNNPDFALP